jgi:hypothetical protein
MIFTPAELADFLREADQEDNQTDTPDERTDDADRVTL